MATRTIITDDLDGTEAWRTIRFGFDGKLFEIDLSREHYESFKHGLGPWMEAGREVSKYTNKPGAGTGGGPGSRGPYRNGKENEKIRTWGRENHFDVPERGKIPQALQVAYELAHQKGKDEEAPAARPVPRAPVPAA